MPRPKPLVALHGAVSFERLVPFDPATPISVNDLLVFRREAGGPNLIARVGDVAGGGGAVNISDLMGGVDDDMMYRVAGVWTGTGGTGLTYNGSQFKLPQANMPAAPTFAFGDGDSGFFESADDVIRIAIAGVASFEISVNGIDAVVADGFRLRNGGATATSPTLIPHKADLDTGIGRASADILSLIAGAIQIAQAKEVPGANQFILTPGLIDNNPAFPTLAFGDGDTGFRENVDDTIKVTLAGVDRWTFTGDRFVGVVGNGPSLQNEGSTATNPTLIPALGDPSTGIGGVTGALALIVGGLTAINLRRAGADIFVEAGIAVFEGKAGIVSIPTYSFALDSNSGMYSGGAGSDQLKFSAGGVEALGLHELNSGVIQSPQAALTITAFAGGGQGAAVQLNASYNVLSVVASGGDSVKLPPVFVANSIVYVKNDGAESANIFPATGDNLGNGTNAAEAIPAGEFRAFIATAANAIWTALLPGMGGGAASFTELVYNAVDFDNPNNADWDTNALAPAVADSNNAALTIRAFDDTIVEGVGGFMFLPIGATSFTFNFVGRAETTPPAVRNVRMSLRVREIPDNGAITSPPWITGNLANFDIPTNELFQYDSQTFTFAFFGFAAGELIQFELVRVGTVVGTDLVGDYDLLRLRIGFS